METLEDKLVEVIRQELRLEPGQVTLDTPLADLGDSLDWLSIVSAVEEAFAIRMDDDSKPVTVRDLMQLLEEPTLA